MKTEIISRKALKLVSEQDIPLEVRRMFNLLKATHGDLSIRISSLVALLQEVTGVILDDVVDLKSSWSPMVLSELLDTQKNFYDGKEVEISEFFERICEIFQIGKKKKQLMYKNGVEDGLWAILLILTDPNHPMFNI